MANYSSDVEITLSTGGQSITLPINPRVLPTTISGANETVEVVGLGQIVVPRKPNLKTVPIESFFDDDSYTQFLIDAFTKKRVLRIVVTGIEFKTMRAVIQNLSYEKRAGEENDTYYNFDLIEYVPYGATLLQILPNKAAAPSTPSRPTDSKPATPSSHTVKAGESPWSITQKYTGNGSRYQEFLDANRSLWTKQGNMIHPGNVVSLPSGW